MKMTRDEIDALFAREFPQARQSLSGFVIEDVFDGGCRVRLPYDERHLRPGGTISGPSMFALADVALYIAILAAIGPVTLAVTTNMNLNFLRKPAARDLIGTCHLIKLGRRMAVGEVELRSDGEEALVAHAIGTYSIPPNR